MQPHLLLSRGHRFLRLQPPLARPTPCLRATRRVEAKYSRTVRGGKVRSGPVSAYRVAGLRLTRLPLCRTMGCVSGQPRCLERGPSAGAIDQDSTEVYA